MILYTHTKQSHSTIVARVKWYFRYTFSHDRIRECIGRIRLSVLLNAHVRLPAHLPEGEQSALPSAASLLINNTTGEERNRYTTSNSKTNKYATLKEAFITLCGSCAGGCVRYSISFGLTVIIYVHNLTTNTVSADLFDGTPTTLE